MLEIIGYIIATTENCRNFSDISQSAILRDSTSIFRPNATWGSGCLEAVLVRHGDPNTEGRTLSVYVGDGGSFHIAYAGENKTDREFIVGPSEVTTESAFALGDYRFYMVYGGTADEMKIRFDRILQHPDLVEKFPLTDLAARRDNIIPLKHTASM